MSLAAAGGGWMAALVATGAWLVVKRALAARLETVARACHELRGPLTAVRLGLEPGSGGQVASGARLRAISLEVSRATLALDDLAAALEQRSVMPASELVDLQELIANSVEAWRASAEAAGVRLRLASARCAGAVVQGDRRRLAQAVGNLIANAIEHGGDRVEVLSAAHEGHARVEVIDNGPGLPAQVRSLARPRSGRGRRGRGLAITASIAGLHGGQLVAGSAEQQGARLALVFPAARS